MKLVILRTSFLGILRPQGARSGLSDGVHRLALSTTVVMVDPTTLVMSTNQTGADEIGDGTTDVAPAGAPDPFTDFSIYRLCGPLGVFWQSVLCSKRRFDLFDDHKPTGIALRHRNQ